MIRELRVYGWYRVGYIFHNHIVGGDAVGRDEEEGFVVDLVQVAHFAARDEGQGALEVGLGVCGGHCLGWIGDNGWMRGAWTKKKFERNEG